jgi:hypothetical protein
MKLTKRELRVINAFLNCIRTGEYTEYYAILLIEDESRYGWMSDAAKDYFYEELEKIHPEPEPEPEEPGDDA